MQQLDDLRADLGAHRRATARSAGAAARCRVGDEPSGCRAELQAWFGWDEFERAFRGSEEKVRDRYRDLAAALRGLRSRARHRLRARRVPRPARARSASSASGIEVDADLVHARRGARARRAPRRRAASYLATLPDASLGGVCALQVVEHLSPQAYVDFARRPARVVRPGGLVVIDSPNPSSFYVYAHAFYLDPTHTRPVHPLFLMFLFDRAGFEKVELEWRSPPPDAALLEPVPGDDDARARGQREHRAAQRGALRSAGLRDHRPPMTGIAHVVGPHRGRRSAHARGARARGRDA